MKPSRSVSTRSKLKWSAVFLSLFCSLSLQATSLKCEGVTLSLIDDSARANIEILEGRASDADIEAALQMPGNLALVEKSNQNGSSNTIEDLRIALKSAQGGGTPEPDLFGIGRLRRDIEDAKALLALLEREVEQIIINVCATLKPYLPPGYAEDIRVFVLSGGYATGFTFDAGKEFYLAAQRIGDDPAGLELIIVHELFHVIQASLSPLSIAKMEELSKTFPVRSRALKHLNNGYQEGGASWVANADDYTGEGRTINFFKQAQGRYSKEFKRQFVTFEAYLYQLYNDPEADEKRIYSAGFMGDGPLYFVGFYMARELEKENGPQFIRDLLSQSPVVFFQQYLALCHTNKRILCFSPSTEYIIDQLAAMVHQ